MRNKKILSNFLFKICKIKLRFKIENFLETRVNDLRIKLNNKRGAF